MDFSSLMQGALEARRASYAPYSGFAVGAALLCADGSVYTGCNVENAAFSPSVCAERVAVYRAVADGKRDFAAIAIAGGRAGEQPARHCPPCGVCRQVLMEFCAPDSFIVALGTSGDDVKTYLLRELMPVSFSKSGL